MISEVLKTTFQASQEPESGFYEKERGHECCFSDCYFLHVSLTAVFHKIGTVARLGKYCP